MILKDQKASLEEVITPLDLGLHPVNKTDSWYNEKYKKINISVQVAQS